MMTTLTLGTPLSFDLDGGIYHLIQESHDKPCYKVPYGLGTITIPRSGPLCCPYCNSPLFHTEDRTRTFCVNAQCTPRIRPIVQMQMDHLDIDLSVVHAVLYKGLDQFLTLPVGLKTLLYVGLVWPDAYVREAIMEKLKALSFTDFLMLLQVPRMALSSVEDAYGHVRTLQNLMECLMYDHGYVDALRLARFAIMVNRPLADALIQYNTRTFPIWTEGY